MRAREEGKEIHLRHMQELDAFLHSNANPFCVLEPEDARVKRDVVPIRRVVERRWPAVVHVRTKKNSVACME